MMKIETDQHGEIDVELHEGCGNNPTGISLRVNGICVVHLTGMRDLYAKMDVYSTAARVAGFNWVDIHAGEVGNTKCVGTF
jgi:hypothetical protein